MEEPGRLRPVPAFMRSQVILLVLLALAATGLLILATGSVDPLKGASVGSGLPGGGPGAVADLAELAALDGGGGDQGAASRTEAIATGPGVFNLAPSDVTDGLRVHRARVRAVDLYSGLPIQGAQVLDVRYDGEALARDERFDATESDEAGAIEIMIRLHPVAAEDDVMWKQLDVRLGGAGYVAVVSPALPFEPLPAEGDSESTMPARTVLLERAATLELSVHGDLGEGRGTLNLWFDTDGRRRSPSLVLDWPLPLKGVVVPSGPEGEGGARIEAVATAAGADIAGLPPGPLTVALVVPGRPVCLVPALRLFPGEVLHAELSVESGEIVRGTILDLESGSPVEGVAVLLTPQVSGLSEDFNRLPYPVRSTGRDGSFEFTGSPLGPIGVSLVTPDGARHERKITVREGNGARTHRLRVRGSGLVTGKLVLPPGVAASEVSLALTTKEMARRVRYRRGELAVRGDSGWSAEAAIDPVTGEFSFEQAPSGRPLVLQAKAPSTALAEVSLAPLRRGELREDVLVTLSAGTPLRVKVTGEGGVPVGPEERLEISLRPVDSRDGSPRPWSRSKAVTPEPGGICQLGIQSAAIGRIRITRPRSQMMEFPWPKGQGTSDGEGVPTFEVPESPVVAFELRGSDGRAIAGARLTAILLPEAAAPGADPVPRRILSRAHSDPYGRAVMLLPKSGEAYRIRVRAEGYVSSLVDLTSRSGEPLRRELVLERAAPPEPATVTGRLVRGSSGRPMLAVRFDGLRGGTGILDGHDFEIRGVRPGKVRLVLHAEGFESAVLPVQALEPGQELDVGEIRMRPGTRLDVVVTGAKGQPIRSAEVKLVRLPPKEAGRGGLPRVVRFPAQATTAGAPRGAFRRNAVPRASWRLVVKHPGHRPSRRTIKVQGARMTVKVALEGAP